MRLLIITPAFYPINGGYANAVTSFVQSLLAQTDMRVDVLTFTTLNREDEIQLKNLEVHRLKRHSIGRGFNFLINEMRLAKKIASLDREKGYDFVMFETGSYPLAGLLILRDADLARKCFVRIHAGSDTEWMMFRDHINYKLQRIFLKRFIRRINTITSTNNYHLGFVIKHYLSGSPFFYGKKLFDIIPNTTLSAENNSATKERLERRFGYIRQKYSFFALGRMDYPGDMEKNFSRMLEAVYYLRDKDYFSKILFIIVGEGKGKLKLQSLSKALGIQNSVKFIDKLENHEVQFLQKKVSCVVIASLYEGMSSFGTESLKNGACLLVPEKSGVSCLVEGGKNGYLLKPIDSRNIAENIDKVVRLIIPKIDTARDKSKRLYREKFDHKRIMHSFLQFLDVLKAYKTRDSKSERNG